MKVSIQHAAKMHAWVILMKSDVGRMSLSGWPGESQAHRHPPPLFWMFFTTGKQGCAGGGEAGCRIFKLSTPQRIGDLRGGGGEEGPGSFLVPLGCLWSRTHLSLGESAEETLESDIHPLPTPILVMLCMTATATQLAG